MEIFMRCLWISALCFTTGLITQLSSQSVVNKADQKLPWASVSISPPWNKTFSQSSKTGSYPTDTLILSNYGEPNKLVMGLGEQYAGEVARYSVCNIWAVRQIGGHVDWGDKTDTPLIETDPLSNGQAVTSKIYSQSGTFAVHADIGADCIDNHAGHDVHNVVSGNATAFVYESIPIKSFVISCGTSLPCTGIHGGQPLSGIVTLSAKSINLGTLVRPVVSGPAYTVPYMIVTPKLDTVSFDISTVAVSSNTSVSISVTSGGVTLLSTVPVIP